MEFFRIYWRVLGLLGPERRLGTQLGPAEATKTSSAMREAEADLYDPAASRGRAGNSPVSGE